MGKKAVFSLFLILIMIVLIFLMSHAYMRVQQLNKTVTTGPSTYLLIFYALLFGICLSWRDLYTLLKGKLQLNFLIIPCVLVGILSFIPPSQWVRWFGLGLGWWNLLPLKLGFVHVILAIITGILLVRSFAEKPASL